MTDYLPPDAPFGDDKNTAPSTSTAVPHNREAEEAVVGAVFINQEVYYDIAQFLSADDFYIRIQTQNTFENAIVKVLVCQYPDHDLFWRST